jgi:hypothetical protein
MTWSQVYGEMSQDSSAKQCGLVRGLLRFMESKGMDNSGITGDVSNIVSSGRRFRDFVKICKDITDDMIRVILGQQKEITKFAAKSPANLGRTEKRHWYYGRYLCKKKDPIQLWIGLAWPDEGEGKEELVVLIYLKSEDDQSGWHEHLNKSLKSLNGNWRRKWHDWPGYTCVIPVQQLAPSFFGLRRDEQVDCLAKWCLDRLQSVPPKP